MFHCFVCHFPILKTIAAPDVNSNFPDSVTTTLECKNPTCMSIFRLGITVVHVPDVEQLKAVKKNQTT
jgi:aspartate carbamoyltransferase regulatory subunit